MRHFHRAGASTAEDSQASRKLALSLPIKAPSFRRLAEIGGPRQRWKGGCEAANGFPKTLLPKRANDSVRSLPQGRGSRQGGPRGTDGIGPQGQPPLDLDLNLSAKGAIPLDLDLDLNLSAKGAIPLDLDLLPAIGQSLQHFLKKFSLPCSQNGTFWNVYSRGTKSPWIGQAILLFPDQPAAGRFYEDRPANRIRFPSLPRWPSRRARDQV